MSAARPAWILGPWLPCRWHWTGAQAALMLRSFSLEGLAFSFSSLYLDTGKARLYTFLQTSPWSSHPGRLTRRVETTSERHRPGRHAERCSATEAARGAELSVSAGLWLTPFYRKRKWRNMAFLQFPHHYLLLLPYRVRLQHCEDRRFISAGWGYSSVVLSQSTELYWTTGSLTCACDLFACVYR